VRAAREDGDVAELLGVLCRARWDTGVLHALTKCNLPPGLPRVIRQEDGSRDRFEAIFQAIDVDGSKSVSLEEFVEFLVRNCTDRLRSHVSSSLRESNSAMAPQVAPTSAIERPSRAAAYTPSTPAAGDATAAVTAASPVVGRTTMSASETWLDARKDMPALRDIGAEATAAADVADSSSFALALVAERAETVAAASILSCTTQSSLSIVPNHVHAADTHVSRIDIDLAAREEPRVLPMKAVHRDVGPPPQDLVLHVPRYPAAGGGTSHLDSSTGVGGERDASASSVLVRAAPPPPPVVPTREAKPLSSALPTTAESVAPVLDAHHATVDALVVGGLSGTTTTEAASPHDVARAVFDRLDRNGDGVISRGELIYGARQSADIAALLGAVRCAATVLGSCH
jgi:EF hand/EF-hand domain pair